MLPLLVLIFCGSLVWFLGKCIGFIVFLTALIADDKVELWQEFGPPYLSQCQFLYGYEILKTFLIGEDFYWQAGALEFWPPFFETVNYGEKFFVIYLVIALNGRYFSQKVGHWV